MCFKNCAHGAISFPGKKAQIDHDKCVGCGRCIGVCPADAVQAAQDEAFDILNRKMSEYAWAVVKDRPGFHVSLVLDVSPFCDCHPENDVPIVPDVGIFASFDPVALDTACADAVNGSRSFPTACLPDGARKKRTTSMRCTPTPTGGSASSRPSKWGWEARNTSWSRSNNRKKPPAYCGRLLLFREAGEAAVTGRGSRA